MAHIANNLIFAADLVNEAQWQDQRADRIFHERIDAFELADRQFINLFRLNKHTAERLIDLVDGHLPDPTRASALDTTTMVLTALKYFGGGSYQSDVGHNKYIAVSQSSVSRCINRVSEILNKQEIMREWIRFPRNIQEMEIIRNRFWEKYDFPNTIGCIDCTHVAIYPPKIHDPVYPEHIYVNRKGYHSINVQLICNADYKIINVNARYPGSTHDSFIWNNSNVLPIMRDVYNRNQRMFLIGDSGYALRPWLMTPLLHAVEGTPEEYFSTRLKSVRSLIERVNGILKMRFRCLLKHRVLHYCPETASKIINACCVLHNMCIQNNLPDPVPDPEEDNVPIDYGLYEPAVIEEAIVRNRGNPELRAGDRVREQMIRQLWRLRDR